MSNINKKIFLQKKRSLSSFRSDKNTLKKKKSSKEIPVKGPWSSKEDELLKNWIKTVGPKKWTQCALSIPGRSGKQCREHWNNSLNSNIIKGNWTVEEDYLLMQFYEKLGKSWKKIIPIFKSRTENSIKNRFFSQLRKIASKYIKTGKKEYSTKFGLDILSKYYKEGLEESKKLFLKKSNIDEKELDEYINNIENLLKKKPKNEKYIDIELLRKKKDIILDIKNSETIDIKVNEEDNNGKLNKVTQSNIDTEKIDEIKEINNVKIKNNLQNKKYTINKDNSITSDDSFDLEINKSENNKKENSHKKVENIIEILNNNRNKEEEIKKNKNMNNIINNDAIKDINNNMNNSNNVNCNINNTINFIINNFNNNCFNNMNYNNMNAINDNNMLNNVATNMTINNTSNNFTSNIFNNINSYYNPHNFKNPYFYPNNNGFNINMLNIDRSNQLSGLYSKKSSDLSEYLMNDQEFLANNKTQYQTKNSRDVFALLNSYNSNSNLNDINMNNFNNNEYMHMNSGDYIEQSHYWNSGVFNLQSGKLNCYEDKKNLISPMTPIMDRKFQFPILRHSDSNDINKGMIPNFPSGSFGFNRLGSFTSIKDINNNDNILDESNKKI